MGNAAKTIGYGVPDTVGLSLCGYNSVWKTRRRLLFQSISAFTALNDGPDVMFRCGVSRTAWKSISDEVKRIFNERLNVREETQAQQVVCWWRTFVEPSW